MQIKFILIQLQDLLMIREQIENAIKFLHSAEVIFKMLIYTSIVFLHRGPLTQQNCG